MRTTIKIEAAEKTLELDLKLVDGKQVVELELSELLSLLSLKPSKAQGQAKPQKVKGAVRAKRGSKAMAEKVDSDTAVAVVKRGRKAKINPSEAMIEPVLN